MISNWSLCSTPTKLLQGINVHNKSQTITNSVSRGIMQNKNTFERQLERPQRKITPKLDLSHLKHLKNVSKIHVFRKPSFAKNRCQSVIERRRNWNTSARNHSGDDSPLDLSKKEFGVEYRSVLDKLLKPKLPDNRELKGDPKYEYAQKANKLRFNKKVDLIKNSEFLKYLQRKTYTTFIRNMMCIMKERKKKKFSVLEMDTKLGMK